MTTSTAATRTPLPPRLHTALYINGKWRPGSARERIDVVDPATGEPIAHIAAADLADCRAAVDAAESASSAWAATSPRSRADVLLRACQLMQSERESLAALIATENGKAYIDALGEVNYASEFFRWYAEEAVRVGGDFRLSPSGDKRIVVSHEPIGVCLLITPWNFPAAMATRKIGPALAAGCTTVLKPATATPLTAAAVVDILDRAGVPPGVVNLVTPKHTGSAVREMLHHPATRKLSFTGSTEIGRVLLHEAAEKVVSTSMELGGNAPFLVLSSADVQAAVAGAVVAKMRNGGSACTAANRFYVHESLSDEFSERLAHELSSLQVGPGARTTTQVGALVSESEKNKIAALVSEAIDYGARALVGGPGEDLAGAFYPPTVLTDLDHENPILGHEIFGPVAPVVRFADEERAIGWANRTEMGLVSYVYGNVDDAIRAAHRLQSGMVAVNRGVLSDPAAPFGGIKQSGLGREGSKEGISEYLEQKYIAVDL